MVEKNLIIGLGASRLGLFGFTSHLGLPWLFGLHNRLFLLGLGLRFLVSRLDRRLGLYRLSLYQGIHFLLSCSKIILLHQHCRHNSFLPIGFDNYLLCKRKLVLSLCLSRFIFLIQFVLDWFFNSHLVLLNIIKLEYFELILRRNKRSH